MSDLRWFIPLYRFRARVCGALVLVVMSVFGAASPITSVWAASSEVVAARSAHREASPGSFRDLPDGFDATLAGNRTEIDGRRVEIWSLSAVTNPVDAINSVDSRWREQVGAPVQREERAGWLIVSRWHLGSFETVQIRADAPTADGYLSRWRPMQSGSSSRSHVARWLPSSVRTGSEVVSVDGAITVRTLVGSSHEQPERLLEVIADTAHRAGLRRVDTRHGARTGGNSAQEPGSRQRREDGLVAWFAGQGRELTVTVNRSGGGTAIVAHLTETVR